MGSSDEGNKRLHANGTEHEATRAADATQERLREQTEQADHEQADHEQADHEEAEQAVLVEQVAPEAQVAPDAATPVTSVDPVESDAPASSTVPEAMQASRVADDPPFYIVGIGASAGGLEALEAFFDNMPLSDEFAFVIIQHLSPDYKSLMPELLNRHTRFTIHQAEEGMRVQPGCIYLNQPKKNLIIFNDTLFFAPQEQGLNLPIDIFLRALAEDRGEKAIGVILSGTGTDGTRGIRAIKEAGGMVMVQDEESAQFDGMPRSALSTGIVDYVLAPERMPEELKSFIAGHYSLAKRGDAHDGPPPEDALAKILAMIRTKTGIDFSFYKPNTIVRRIERRMGINQIETAEQYIRFMESSPNEAHTLFKEILIGVTKFFREPDAFETIKTKVLPEIFKHKKPNDAVRVWVAGCSTGEEAYSLAIVFSEYCEEHNLLNDIKIFSTDIDRDALDFASYGIYPESIVADISMQRLGRYFLKKGDSYQVKPAIREKVIFAYHNILKDPPFARTDLISCRNLLIYLQPPLQKRVLSNFQFSLNPDGFLFLGSSETVGDLSSYFKSVDIKWKILRNQGGRSRMNVETALAGADLAVRRYDQRKPAITSHTGRQSVSESLLEQAISRCLPPAVLVDSSRSVVHIFGEVSEYLRLPTGRMNTDVTKMAVKDIGIPLATGLQQTMRSGEDVTYRNIRASLGSRVTNLDMTIRHINVQDEDYYMILLDERPEEKYDESEAEDYSIQAHVQKRINDLEQELQFSKENLQATIEEVETSNEELQATNEELLASNEELQSTNEELQSVNEELLTVNAEYQKKITELTELNDDMDNLMASTEIGTIFFDSDLCVRKFTQPATKIFHLIKSDLGRPITHISHNLEYGEFQEDVERVLRESAPREFEAQNKEGEWFLVRIMPYRTGGKEISGVVVSFVDITARKAYQEQLFQQSEMLHQVVETSPAATLMVDKDGAIRFVNKELVSLFGRSREELTSLQLDDPALGLTDLEGEPLSTEETPLGRIRQTREPLAKYILAVQPDGRDTVVVNVSGNPLKGQDGEFEGAVFKFETLAWKHADA